MIRVRYDETRALCEGGALAVGAQAFDLTALLAAAARLVALVPARDLERKRGTRHVVATTRARGGAARRTAMA